MTKAKYASEEERRAALSVQARAQMLAQWQTQRAAEGKDIPGYDGRHRRVQKARGRAADQSCTGCGGQAKDWAQRHETRGDDPADYDPMCRRCHFAYDGVGAKIVAAKGSDGCRRVAELAWSRRTPERRREIAAKAHATRRRNLGQTDDLPGEPA